MADRTDELFTRHRRLVYAMCMRLADDPEDAAQEIWEKVTRAAARFDENHSTPARAWIATIARRHLIDRHRRRQVRGTEVPADDLEDPRDDPERVVELNSRQRSLERALRRLPAAQRHVVVMHHIHGVPLVTLAEDEGVALGTIKSRLHRGRAGLARLLRSH